MISAIFVSYRSGEATVAAIESFRRSSPKPCETIVVVNSGDKLEEALVRGAADRVVAPDRNLGFAGGLNAGIEVSKGEILLLANPDLVFLDDAVRRLVAGAETDALAAYGPLFFLDDAATILMPPAEEPHPLALVRRRAAGGAPFRREVRRVLALRERAERGEDVPCRALSGALVAMSRKTLRAVGPFDEGYPLYFEENDWQRRLVRLGGRLVQVTKACVVHHYNQSAKTEPRAEAWFGQSARRFYATHYGERGLQALAQPLPDPPAPSGTLRLDGAVDAGIALSPRPDFRPFAYALLPDGATGWSPPEDVLHRLAGTWYLRAFDRASGRVLGEGALGVR